jgi:hypothetical protein
MRGFYTVHSQAEFEAWMNEQVASLPSYQTRLAGLMAGSSSDSSPSALPDSPTLSSDGETPAGGTQ